MLSKISSAAAFLSTLAVADIPAAVPHLAARLWLEMSFEPSAQEFLSNPWAIQIHLDQAGQYNTCHMLFLKSRLST